MLSFFKLTPVLFILASCASSAKSNARTANTIDETSNSLEVHGHRGARAKFPENSIPAFEYAIQVGVEALEMDCQLTKEGIVIISHDPKPNGTHCKMSNNTAVQDKRFDSMTLSEIKELDCGSLGNPDFPDQAKISGTTIPTLDEVLTMVQKSRIKTFNLNIEIKTTPESHNDQQVKEFVDLVLANIKKFDLIDRSIIQSFDPRALVFARNAEPNVVISYLSMGPFAKWVSKAIELKAQYTSPAFALVNATGVNEAHAAGIKVLPWTANQPDIWAKLISMGVDGIISDDPEALKTYLKSPH